MTVPFPLLRPVTLPRFNLAVLAAPIKGTQWVPAVMVPYPVARELGAWALQLEDEALAQANTLLQAFDPSTPVLGRYHPQVDLYLTENDLERCHVAMLPWDPEFTLLRAAYPDRHREVKLEKQLWYASLRAEDEPEDASYGYPDEIAGHPTDPVSFALNALAAALGSHFSSWEMTFDLNVPATDERNLGLLLSATERSGLNLRALPGEPVLPVDASPLERLAALGRWMRANTDPALPACNAVRPELRLAWMDARQRLAADAVPGYTVRPLIADETFGRYQLIRYHGVPIGVTRTFLNELYAQLTGEELPHRSCSCRNPESLQDFPPEENLPF